MELCFVPPFGGDAMKTTTSSKVKTLNEPSTFYQACEKAGLIGCIKNGPGDLAKNHSLYLKGLKLWKPERAEKKKKAA